MSDEFQRVTIVTPNAPAPVGHDEKMIALVDAKNAEAAGVQVDAEAPRPEWLPAKFKTVEELAASYAALEAKQSTPVVSPAVPLVAPLVAPAADPLAIAADPAVAAVATAGLDMAALNAEYAEKGELSTESLAKLAAAGFDKNAVDDYIAGKQARADAFKADVLAVTPGGAEKYVEMVEWAKVNLTPAEKAAFNSAVGSGNAEQAKLAVAGLGVKFTADVGSEPTLINGRQEANAGDVFESKAQMVAAMSDPKYKSDPAYRRAVGAKLGRSSFM